MNVVAIFDIGKTNKKVFLFNESYQIVWEKSIVLDETIDEDGFACENSLELRNWIADRLTELKELKEYNLKAVNFSTYGASFIYVDKDGKALTPLYNYLKPYPEELLESFYPKYKGRKNFAVKTASPILGSLNSGMQIYRFKQEKPELFSQVHYCLHLPQYLSSILTGRYFTDITSIGCHTGLWNFKKMSYHKWVTKEEIVEKLPPIHNAEVSIKIEDGISVGIGLHDSSAALIPYILNFTEPFVLLSTGTWSISLNPFNDKPLTSEELHNDCLCFLQYKNVPVKAARLFAGNTHEIETKRIAKHFGIPNNFFKEITYNKEIIAELKDKNSKDILFNTTQIEKCLFESRDLNNFENYEIAYNQLIIDIVEQQKISTHLVIHNSPVKKIFVDGGFSKNSIFMNLLAQAYPQMEVYAASMAQASALGAALAIHNSWNPKPIQNDLIDLKFYKH